MTCRLKLDGRVGTMRWQTRHGKSVRSDRLGALRAVAAEQVLAGTGSDFEVRRSGTPSRWHRLTLSEAEAAEVVRSTRVGAAAGERRVQQLLAMRG